MKKQFKEQLKKIKSSKRTPKIIITLLLVVCFIIVDILLIKNIIIPAYHQMQERKAEKEYQEILKTATIRVELTDNLETSFYSDVKVSDFLKSINGTLVDDYKIDTSTIGKKKVKFEYINEEDIRIPYAYTITIKDDIAPSIWLSSTYSVNVGYNGNLLDDITCADNLDDNPKCEIIGDYNLNKVGSYSLTFKATDNSGNITTKEFTLKVKKPKNNSSSNSNTNYSKTLFSDIVKEHKKDNTLIGIDVSSWQGNIDFEKVKEAGVEFVFIRVGSTRGINGEYFVVKQFINNIEGFNSVGIPVGIFFYSYANSKKAAIADAKWVLEQIKGYDIDLPIVYDWESWSFYNEFNQSFYSTSMNAKAFLEEIKKAGYQGMLYSSKSYLERVWVDIGYPVWLAHYTTKTSYTGDYDYWQLCSNGKISGIAGDVDINIYYKTKEE